MMAQDASQAEQRAAATTARQKVNPSRIRDLATEESALAFWLGDKRRMGYAQLKGGIGWHVRDARRQNVVGMPDVLMLLPIPTQFDWAPFQLVVGIEIKINDDRVTAEQQDAIDRINRIPGYGGVAGIVRYGRPPRIDEWDQDQAVAAIEEALR